MEDIALQLVGLGGPVASLLALCIVAAIVLWTKFLVPILRQRDEAGEQVAVLVETVGKLSTEVGNLAARVEAILDAQDVHTHQAAELQQQIENMNRTITTTIEVIKLFAGINRPNRLDGING